MWYLFFLISIFASSISFASILPPNNLHHQDSIANIYEINESEFNVILDHIEKFYTPVVARFGANLKVVRHWKNPTVNAYARRIEKDWIIEMFGGLARRPEITKDGFALVACHELGHHLGGFPVHPIGRRQWFAASEGQADYFSTQSCAKEIWKNDVAENARSRPIVTKNIKMLCDKSFQSEDDQNLCYRIGMGSESLAALMSKLSGQPPAQIDTPDLGRVLESIASHPRPQCRLDTYIAGTLCQKHFDITKIPGLDRINDFKGIKTELESYESSCSYYGGQSVGVRPNCWYQPQLQHPRLQLAATKVTFEDNKTSDPLPGKSIDWKYTIRNQTGRIQSNVHGTQSIISHFDIGQPATNYRVGSILPYQTASTKEKIKTKLNAGTSKYCGHQFAVYRTFTSAKGLENSFFQLMRVGRLDFGSIDYSFNTSYLLSAGSPTYDQIYTGLKTKLNGWYEYMVEATLEDPNNFSLMLMWQLEDGYLSGFPVWNNSATIGNRVTIKGYRQIFIDDKPIVFLVEKTHTGASGTIDRIQFRKVTPNCTESLEDDSASIVREDRLEHPSLKVKLQQNLEGPIL